MAQSSGQSGRSRATQPWDVQALLSVRSWKLAIKIAYRNLFHDHMSLLVTLIGIVFSVVLLTVQLGLYIGSERMIAAMHDHSSADLWVVPEGTECFDDASFLQGRERFSIAAISGVAKVEEVIAGYALWRRPSGGSTAVLVVGSDQTAKTLVPWDLIRSSPRALSAPSAVSVDQTYLKDLGVARMGDRAEINGAAVKVASISQGIRSFTTVPYVFTSLPLARALLFASDDQSTYALIKLEPGANIAKVKAAVEKRIEGVEALTHDEFRSRSLDYWLEETGAGAALMTGAILGLIVGLVIVAQTLYASTKDHLNEFATLRALGASAGYIRRIILLQAVLSAVLGYAIGIWLSMLAVAASQGSSLYIVVTPDLGVTLFVLTVFMCVVAALGAIFKVTRIDPAAVFNS